MNRRTLLATAGTALGSGLTTTTAADAVSQEGTTPPTPNVEFHDCENATVSGTFTDGDVAYASTGWYDDQGLYGNTLLEHGIEFGPDAANSIDTPFEGTISFSIGEFANLDVSGPSISVTVPGAQDDAVLTGLTTNRDDYLTASLTHQNPHSDSCLQARQDGSDEASDFQVSVLRTNGPVNSGESIEVQASVENRGGAGDAQSVALLAGDSPDPVDSETVSLDPMTGTTLTLSHTAPTVDTDQTIPVYVESEDNGVRETVTVRADSQDFGWWDFW